MRLLLMLGAMCALTLPLTPVLAEDEVGKEDGVTIGTIPADPRTADTPIDLVKPPTIIRTANYVISWESDPPTIQVAERFDIDLSLSDAAQEAGLMLEPGSTASLVLLQNRGYCALVAPLTIAPDGTVTSTSQLVLPYSGGYEGYLNFQPAGGDPVTEHVSFFVEGIAENGKDITAMPRYDGPWDSMPAFTSYVNRSISAESAMPTSATGPRCETVDYELKSELLEKPDTLGFIVDAGDLPVILIRADGGTMMDEPIAMSSESMSDDHATF